MFGNVWLETSKEHLCCVRCSKKWGKNKIHSNPSYVYFVRNTCKRCFFMSKQSRLGDNLTEGSVLSVEPRKLVLVIYCKILFILL